MNQRLSLFLDNRLLRQELMAIDIEEAGTEEASPNVGEIHEVPSVFRRAAAYIRTVFSGGGCCVPESEPK